jgi:predicted ATP-dependent endonuclease of OLD family
MKLNKLKLKNFRSYSQETEIDVSDLNVIIGKNDVGKSSILEALDIFFNSKPDKNDLCIENDNSRIEITCIFSDFPEQLILDDTNPTSLSDEYLLNSDNKHEIKKSFPISASGSVSEESVIICDYPDNENLSDLLSKKRTTLQLQFDELGINPEGVNRNKSKELRNAIRNHYYEEGQITTKQAEIKIDGRLDNEDNRKKIWTNLKKYLPLYSLFFVDKQLNDQD